MRPYLGTPLSSLTASQDFESAVYERELVNMDGVKYKGNDRYYAPEVFERQMGHNKHGRRVFYGHRRDVYGAGIILGELLLGYGPSQYILTHDLSRRRFRGALGGSRGTMQDALNGLRLYGSLEDSTFNLHLRRDSEFSLLFLDCW